MDRLHLLVFLSQIRNGILEEYRIKANGGADERHVPKEGHKCVEARLPLKEMIRIIPRRP